MQEFITQCYDDYKNQTEGIVPRCLWENTSEALSYYADPAFTSGIVDGAYDMVKGASDLGNFINAWTSPTYAFTSEAKDIRDQTCAFFDYACLFIKDEGTTRQDVKKEFKSYIENYIDETTAIDAQARYNHGKLLFNIASFFIGVGEIKELASGAKFIDVLVASAKGMVKLPAALIKGTGRLVKKGLIKIEKTSQTIILKTLLEIEIARFGNDGVMQISKWISNPKNYEIVEKIEDVIPYKYIGENELYKGLSGTEELALYKATGSNGKELWIGRVVVVRSLDYISSSGTKLIGNVNKTTTILGRWVDDMKDIKRLLNVEDFNVGTSYGKLSQNNGGFNFLNIADDLYISAGDNFFELYNKPWLKAAIDRGDDIILATKPTQKLELISKTGKLQNGSFPQEIKYLVQRDFKPKNITDIEWTTIKNWFK